MSILTLDQIGLTYSDGTEALRNVSLSVAQGEFVSLVGQSGAGKSSLLRMIGGIVSPTAGSLRRQFADDAVGIVFQEPTLMDWRTVVENVRLPLEIKGGEDSAETRIHSLINLVGLEGFENSYPAQLSGGMAQRVGIARALVHSPELLLLDEPFGALDALTRERMGEEMLKIRAAHPVTFFMVTHSIEEAILLSDRILVLSERPGTIIGNIPISLPRPRETDMRYQSDFQQYVAQIRALIGNPSVS